MKGFTRKNQLLSLCGLNCALCPMFLGAYCGGCGNGNQSCSIARCSLAHGQIEYCYMCGQFPCEKYQNAGALDSFITHRRQMADMERAQKIGIDAYNQEQRQKARFLNELLERYNDGRRKSFFCVAVNLMELSEIEEAFCQIHSGVELEALPLKEKCARVTDIFQSIVRRRKLKLKLNRKKAAK